MTGYVHGGWFWPVRCENAVMRKSRILAATWPVSVRCAASNDNGVGV